MSIKLAGASTNQDAEVDVASKAVRSALYDKNGNVLASEVSIDGDYYLGTTITQHVHVSTGNSSVVNIAGNGSFTGSWETILGVAAIQVNVFTNQRTVITLQQSTDGASVDSTYTWNVPASFASARTTQTVAAYYRVIVTNTSASEASSVRIQSCLCPVVETLPRSLSLGGNLRITPAADWQNSNRLSGLYSVSTFSTIGSAGTPQNLFAIENAVANTTLMAIRSLNFTVDSTATLTTLSPQIKTSRTASVPITTGTALTPCKYRTSYGASVANVRGATASDGGVATAITATAGSVLWSQYVDRIQTAVGYMNHPNYNLIPDVGFDGRQIILLPGEALLVQAVTANAATTTFVINCSWYEQIY